MTNDNILLEKVEDVPRDKKLIVFDLDGTLAESKSPIDKEMAVLLEKLIREGKKVAVIGGGKYESFKSQLLEGLPLSPDLLGNLFLFPATATVFYKHDGSTWEQIYREELTEKERSEILSALEKTFSELDYHHPEKLYGEFIEERGGEMVFSALGQEAPLELKEKWNKDNPDIRSEMEKLLQKNLPDMEAKVTGLTSIDITRKGIDKAYGIKQIEKYLNIPVADMLFVGDAFFEEGNDEAVLNSGVDCFRVSGVGDTKKLVEYLIS